jgi:MFS superfamily sulfate permease-like transporter
MSLGTANLLAGSLGGMPVCHGAGGMTAHRAFGARTGAAPLVLGSLLIALALGAGTILGPLLGGFPVPVLAGLLAVAGAMHIALLRDLEGPVEWLLAIGIGVAAVLGGLALALAGGLVLWWCGRAVRSHVASRAGK